MKIVSEGGNNSITVTNSLAEYYSNISKEYAENAEQSAVEARGSENNAATSATQSEASNQKSKVWAEGSDEQVQVLGGEHSAKEWALIASQGGTDVMSLSTNQDVSSTKTFEKKQIIKTTDLDSTNARDRVGTELVFTDLNNKEMGSVGIYYNNNGTPMLRTSVKNDKGIAFSGVGITPDGQTKFFELPDNPSINSDNKDAASTHWVNEKVKNKANIDLDNLSEIGKKVIEDNSGSGMPVGTIFPHSANASFVPENSLPCDGTEYSKAQFPTLYTDWLAKGNLLTCTYEEYEQDVTTNGACAKFALDTVNSKFKVPLIPDGYYIKKGQGTANKAGLPNIIAEFGTEYTMYNYQGCENVTAGPLAKAPPYNQYGVNNTRIKASLSSPIYGRSDTVETNAVAYRYFVVVATGSIKQSEMDWSQWASALAGKANVDGDNFSKLGKELLSGFGMPSGKFIDLTLGTSDSRYTAPANGRIVLVGRGKINGDFATLENLDNGDRDAKVTNFEDNSLSVGLNVLKGATIKVLYHWKYVSYFRFIYAEGSKE